MSIEERTRAEVIHALATIADALRMLLQEREHLANEDVPVITPEAPAKKTRTKKAAPEPLGPPLTSEHEMNVPPLPIPTVGEKMADIKPTKPGKTLADLRVALQECINKHGMPGAKERLAPHAKISDVPDAEIADVIARLAAE